jgi:RimJ/RimL family protein N-acetyltransferase
VLLKLERCSIRSWSLDDVSSLVLYANNLNVWRNLRDRFPHPYTTHDAASWIALARVASPETHFAIDVVSEAVGGIGLDLNTDVYKRSAEIGYWLGEPYWGRGIATDAVRALTEWAFSNFDLCRLYANVFEGNRASARVLEKTGFTLEGILRKSVTKEGRTMDQWIYARVR